MTSDIFGLLIAGLGGAAVGVERQWSGHAEGARARFAGIRLLPDTWPRETALMLLAALLARDDESSDVSREEGR